MDLENIISLALYAVFVFTLVVCTIFILRLGKKIKKIDSDLGNLFLRLANLIVDISREKDSSTNRHYKLEEKIDSIANMVDIRLNDIDHYLSEISSQIESLDRPAKVIRLGDSSAMRRRRKRRKSIEYKEKD